MHELQPGGSFGEQFRDLGVQLRELGKFSEARYCFERALELAPHDGRAHRYLIEIQDAGGSEFGAHAAQIERLLESGELDEGDRIDLHFALAGAQDRLRRYDAALEHFRAANRLRRKRVRYDEPLERTRFALLQRLFNRTIARVAGSGPRDERPIFVIGMPRSGTTLVESLLAPHPQVRALGELTAFERSFNQFGPIEADPNQHALFLEKLRVQIASLGHRYLGEIVPLAGDARRVVDKMPANFRYAVAINLALPAAKIVHVRRNPFDTCFSCYATNFLESQEYSYDVAELGRYYMLYAQHMAHVRTLLAPGVMLELDYEEIVAGVEPAARRLLEHCGLEWDPRVLTFWKHVRPIRTASVVQVRRPVYADSVERAKNNYPAFCEELAAAMAETA